MLSLHACTPTTNSTLFVLCSLQVRSLAGIDCCLPCLTFALFAACGRSTQCLVCALFASLRSLAGCCLPSCAVAFVIPTHSSVPVSLHLRSLLDCDCCLPCLRSLALPVRRLRDASTSARAFRSCPCTSTSAGQARQDKAQNQFVFNIRRARNALLPLSCSAAAAAIVAAEQRRSQRTESASLLSLVFVRRSLCQQRVAPPVTHKHVHRNTYT